MMRLLMAPAMPLANKTTTRPTTGHDHGVSRSAPALPLGALGHQNESRPDDSEEAQARPGVGHAGHHRVEGGQHRGLLVLRVPGGDRGHCRRRGQEDGVDAPYHGKSHQVESPTVVCCALGGSGVAAGTIRSV